MRHVYQFDYLFGGFPVYAARLAAKNASAYLERDTFESTKNRIILLQQLQAQLQASGRSARERNKDDGKKGKKEKGYGGRNARFVHLYFTMLLFE